MSRREDEERSPCGLPDKLQKQIEELLARAIARFKDRVLVDLKIEAGPIAIRLPKSGKRCPYTGLNRTSMRQLVVACPENNFRPPVRSIILRQPGATRGIVLVDYASLKAYLHKLATHQAAERERGESL